MLRMRVRPSFRGRRPGLRHGSSGPRPGGDGLVPHAAGSPAAVEEVGETGEDREEQDRGHRAEYGGCPRRSRTGRGYAGTA
ncbi:hypothetical protein GCM10010493_51040 [Streptomyces lavendulae subsp. grasserius]